MGEWAGLGHFGTEICKEFDKHDDEHGNEDSN
jgi:hypothetical protein